MSAELKLGSSVACEQARALQSPRVLGSAPDFPSHIPSLDGLRAVSISLVIAGHTIQAQEIPGGVGGLVHIGNVGVRFFFVISGFLITTLLLRELQNTSAISLRRFFLRRTLRIFPACFIYILAMWIAARLGWLELLPGDLLSAVTYTMNFHHEHVGYLDHLWSLAVEEQFYLIWPILIVVIGLRPALWVALGMLFLSPVLREYMMLHGSGSRSMTREFQAACDSIAIGCLLSANYNALTRSAAIDRIVKSRFFPVIPFVGLGVSMIGGIWSYYVWGQSIANLAVAAMLFHAIRLPESPIGRVLNSRPLVWIGTLSYSLYLWQQPFLITEVPCWCTRFPQNYLLVLTLAILSYAFVERTFLRWRPKPA